ncbi:MAG TPA: hypothetical protein VF881_05570 [Polyangiaceae bacterium]
MLIFAATLALLGRFVLPAPPPRTIEGLAAMLGQAAAGTVLPSDIAWEPSPGVLAEFLWGRRVLFLARATEGAPRDLFRASVRVTLEGRPVTVGGIRNLTATPLGDERRLVISNERAAFATASYGKIESISLIDLGGKPADPEATLLDGITSAITNWRETGTVRGIGRLDVNLDASESDVLLGIDPERLSIGFGDGKAFAIDVLTGALSGEPAALGAHAYAAPAMRKRPILWAVDTIRAEVGPEPVAMIEAAVFNTRDVMRRSLYALFGPSSQAAAAVAPPPSPPPNVLDASYSQTDTSIWPPAPITPIWKNPEPGEGQWEEVSYPWLKRFSSLGLGKARATGDPPPYFFRTMIRPDPQRPYAQVLIVAMDMRQLELDMEAGVEDPKPLTGANGSGKIPRDPKIMNRVVGAFNGAFKTTHGEYGMMVHRRVLLPPKPGAATLIVTDDRRVGLGNWGSAVDIPSDIVSFRQNLEPLVQDGKLSPSGRTQWGWQLDGTSMMTERSGVCVTAPGQLYYLWGDEVSAQTLGKAMLHAGCTYGMHLDMNPHHTGFVFASVRSLAHKDYDAKLLTPLMEIWPERYLEYSPKDFFYLMLRDPTPGGDFAWTEDVGTQPAPAWLPAVWRAMLQNPAGPSEAQAVQVELWGFDAGRVLWRLRTARQDGQRREYASTELGNDDAHRVMAALGVGNPHEGPNAKIGFGKIPTGLLTADEQTGLHIAAEGDASEKADRDEAIALPMIVEGGKIPAAVKEVRMMRRRGAVCVTPSGHTVVAVATSESDEANARALQRVGCLRAVALDRGAHRPAFLHRAGGGSPPLARYDESVLYAISRPMIPRAQRWNGTE